MSFGRGLEASLAILDLSLKPDDVEPVLAKEQFEYGRRFGDWKVIGPSIMKSYPRTGGGVIYHAMTPVECQCIKKPTRLVRNQVLRWNKSRSCGHNVNPSTREANKEANKASASRRWKKGA